MISIIVCSVNKELLKILKLNVFNTIGTTYEIIAIDNQVTDYSIAQAYNLGASRAKYEYLCFIHEDILFHTHNWGVNLVKHLENVKISLIGIFGCTVKSKIPSGVYSTVENLNRVNQILAVDNQTIPYYHNPYSEKYAEVATLDGMFLACSKENWEKDNFGEDMPTKFHGYDVDFSLAQQKNGVVAVVFDITLQHASTGTYSRQWIDSQLYIINKYKNNLPVIKHDDVNIKEVENSDLNVFIVHLFNNNYLPKIARKLTRKILLRKPIQRLSFFMIKNYLRSFFGIDTTFKP